MLASLSQAIFITILGSFFALYTALALFASFAAATASRAASFFVKGSNVGETSTSFSSVAVFAHEDSETAPLPTATSGAATPLFLPLRSSSSFKVRPFPAQKRKQKQQQQKQQQQQQQLLGTPAASLVLLRRDDSRRKRTDGSSSSPASCLRVCCPNCGGAMSWDEEDERAEEEGAAAPLALCTCEPVAAAGVVEEKKSAAKNNRGLSLLTVSPSTSIELDDAGPSAVGLSPFAR